MRRTFGGLGETEWIVMKCSWKLGKTSARNIYEESLAYGKRSYQTIKTILDRLVEKGVLKREKFGPIWLYNPIASEEKYMTKAIDSFFKIVLGSTFAPIFKRIINEKKYEHELETIKKMIDNLDKS
jgi:BlaI family penicillinase repressor